MEVALRAALVSWLAADTALSTQLNAITEEAPVRASLPWLAIAASASADYSTKTETGREIRVAFELHGRGDRPDSAAALVQAALAYARAQGLRVRPSCSYVRSYMRRHPETQDLLASRG